MSKYKEKKVNKRRKHCETIIKNECGIDSSETPTRFLGILNAGFTTGLTEDQINEAAPLDGQIEELLLLPNKSYCFLSCKSILNAEKIYNGLHNKAKIGQNGATVFLSYFKNWPSDSDNCWAKPLPAGLLIIPDFVTLEEEASLLKAVGNADNSTTITSNGETLKHRRVKHFGFEFRYGDNNVNPDCPLEQKIPSDCDFLWPRLQIALKGYQGFNIDLEWKTPDQLTVNEYEPGQGIPPHVDTHSAFLDPIIALSLESDTVMDFRRKKERVPVILESRSLLVMSGAARYDWTHGIAPRTLDIVPSIIGLTTSKRRKRTSLTFRCVRRNACNCSFPTLCDSRKTETSSDLSLKLEKMAQCLEEENVHNVYEQIANHFSETRHTPWPKVTDFLKSFTSGSCILDIGCGNGKYLACNPNALTIGCDRSLGLLSLCTLNAKSVFRCDCLAIPFRSSSMDGCISIAVIHHLATEERRLAAINEMSRVLKKGGRGLIYVWAKEQCNNNKKSSYLLQNKAINKHKTDEEQQRNQTLQELYHESEKALVNLPVHTNRTDFLQQDVLVPWKLKVPKSVVNEDKPTYLRYYHVFEKGELENLLTQVPGVTLVQGYYDQGNHCVIFERK